MDIERIDVLPRKMSASDYLTFVGQSTKPIEKTLPVPLWDAQLGETMQVRKRVVFEEDLREDLLASIAKFSRGRG